MDTYGIYHQHVMLPSSPSLLTAKYLPWLHLPLHWLLSHFVRMVELCFAADFFHLSEFNLEMRQFRQGNCYGYTSYRCKLYRQVLVNSESTGVGLLLG